MAETYETDLIELPKLHKNQIKVIKDPNRFKVIVAGRRFGKTRLSILYAIKTAINGGRVWFIAPTYNMTQDSYREFKHFANQIPNTHIREVEKRIEFNGGGFIQCKSGDNPDRLRGAGLDLVILDEVAFMKKDVWEVIRPTLTDRQGQAIFISTPNGMGTWFHELTMRADSLDNWSVFRFTTFDNPYIPKEEIEGAKEELGSLVFSQEYLAEFTEFGSIFKSQWARFYETEERKEYDETGNETINQYYILDNEEVQLSECRKYCTVDLAASTKTTADFTVIATVAVTPNNNFIILDLLRRRVEAPDIIPIMKDINDREMPEAFYIEKTGFQLSMVQIARREGLPVKELRADRDKVSRALPLAARMESGKVWFNEQSLWYADLQRELLTFPVGEHDDQVDALAYAVLLIQNQKKFTAY
jgi:predicted phage terminase large subunit-like protein